jgi:hypothetical protein
LYDLIESDYARVWRGRYQGRPHIYRYLTLADGWTYWHMSGRDLLNRDIDRAERQIKRRTAAPAYPAEESVLPI